MVVIIGYWLSSVVALGIVPVGEGSSRHCVRYVHHDPNSKSIGPPARLVHGCRYNHPAGRRSDCFATRRNKGSGIRNSWGDRWNHADHQLLVAVELNPEGAIAAHWVSKRPHLDPALATATS